MKYKITIIALTVLMISSCGTSKNATSTKEDPKQTSNEMQNKGFLEGEIIFSDLEGDCEYTIKTNGDVSEYLDPLNLNEEYKVDGQLIWFKYVGLREKNRCEKARPIKITEIELRKK